MKKLASAKAAAFFVLCMALIAVVTLPIFDTPIVRFANNSAVKRLWWEVLPLVAVLLVTAFFTRVIEKGRIKNCIFGNVAKDGILGVILGAIWLGAVTIILTLTGVMQLVGYNTVPYVWVWVLASLLNVVMQEYLVRGYLFQLLKAKFSPATAIIVTTAFFVLLHGGAIEAGIIPTMNVITMSIFASLLLVYTKSLLAPIIVHFLWNTIGCIMLGGVSLADDYPSIFIFAFSGNTLLSGGALKMEGSIIVLAVNALLIALVAGLILKKKIITIK